MIRLSLSVVFVHVLDGQLELVQLEVQFQHQCTISNNGAGFHVGSSSIIYILAVFLGSLIRLCDINGGVGGALAVISMIQRIRTVRILIVELDLVLSVGVGRPLGVQIVGTDVVHAGGSA